MGRINLGRVVGAATVVTLGHLGLLYGVAQGRVGGALFAAGDLWAVALVLLLVVVRFTAMVLIPALVISNLALVVYKFVEGAVCRPWEPGRRS